MRIVAAIPMQYSTGGHFWERDMGLIVMTLRQLGHEATFVALGDPAGPDDITGLPLLLISRQTMGNPAWWQALRPDAIVLSTHATRRNQDISGAALSTGAVVIEKMDNDGNTRSPRVDFWLYVQWHAVRYYLPRSLLRRSFLWLVALLRALYIYHFPSALDGPTVRGMCRGQLISAESPIAVARFQRMLRTLEAEPMPRVVNFPHSTGPDMLPLEPGVSKQNHVIAVGRWDDAMKGWELLRDTARRFLRLRPDWKILVAGKGAPADHRQLEAEFPGRFVLLGWQGHSALAEHLRAARIYLLPSYFESFNIAAAEALCCGCSVVGPARLATVGLFTSHDSGTPALKRTPTSLTDALLAEVAEWEDGHRDPAEIARYWLARLSPESVAKQLLALVADEAARRTSA